jgi:baseplate J-like protein
VTTYGLTPAGFVIKPLSQIVADFVSSEQSTIDPQLNVDPSGPVGQLNGIMGAAASECWQVLQAVNDQLKRANAEGTQLDGIGDLTGDLRLAPKPSSVYCNCGLLAANSPYPEGTLVAAVSGYPSIQFSNTDDVIVVTDGVQDGILFAALTDGPIEATAGTLTVISAPVTGWSSVTNPLDATPGNLIETDPDYRERQYEELAGTGGSTVDSMQAAILQVQGVISCTVLENVNDITDPVTGLPPHSVSVIIWDGATMLANNQQVINTIWANKSQGAATYGSTSGTVTDSAGNIHTINFSRATQENVYLSFTVTLASGVVLGTIAPIIKQTIAYLSNGFQADGQTPLAEGVPGLLKPGQNVIALVYRAAALAVQGVVDVPVMYLDLHATPTDLGNITIAQNQVGLIETTNILVNGV